LPGEHSKEVLPLLGCAITTALGVLEKDAKVNFRDSLLVFGGGGVGLALIEVAKIFSIKNIVVVDTSEKKLEYVNHLGAIRTVKFTNKAETLLQLKAIYRQDLPSVAIDTTGNTDAIELCYEVSHATGRVILVGVPNADSKAKFYTLPLHFNKIIKGSHGGDSNPEIDIPILLDLMSQKKLNFSNYPIKMFAINDINIAISNLRTGVAGRMILDFTTL